MYSFVKISLSSTIIVWCVELIPNSQKTDHVCTFVTLHPKETYMCVCVCVCVWVYCVYVCVCVGVLCMCVCVGVLCVCVCVLVGRFWVVRDVDQRTWKRRDENWLMNASTER